MTPQQVKTSQVITRALLSCKHDEHIQSVRNMIDNSDLPNDVKQTLYGQCKLKQNSLPTLIMKQTKYWPSFGQQAGTRIIKVKNQ